MYHKVINTSSARFLSTLLCAVLLLSACEKKESDTVEQTPLTPTVGAINARFSVSDGKTVVFSQGNLQYRASAGRWRFAERQYLAMGYANQGIDVYYDGWIDLFGWGTSGYRGHMPYTVSDTASYYGGNTPLSDIAGTNYDWGRFISVENGGDTPGLWRTLTSAEWRHILQYREDAPQKKGLATITASGIGSVNGLVLLPDSWEQPSGCSFSPGLDSGFATNNYTESQWRVMEQAGAVFLPAGGYRSGTTIGLVNSYGCYWSATYYGENTACDLYLYAGDFGLSYSSRCNGECVRLVMDK